MIARQRFAAFSLVELLIVVGIIVVLVAVLVPGLEMVMSRGQVAKCASNLRQLGTGIGSYASANTGLLPPVSSKGVPPVDTLADKYAPRWFAQEEDATTVRVWNLGFLWYGGERAKSHKTGEYIAEGRVYFCPGVTHEDFVWDTYSSGATDSSFPALRYPGDDSNKGDQKLAVRLPYYYNPVMKSANDPAPRYVRVSEMGSYAMLGLDTVETNPNAVDGDQDRIVFQTFGHYNDGPTWNVLGGDNSVKAVADKREGSASTTIAEDAKAAGFAATPLEQRQKLQAVYGRLSGDPSLLP